MTIGQAESRRHPLTVDDLARTPDDGKRYELVDGRLDVSPAPMYPHTLIESRLMIHLGVSAPEEFTVLTGPGINFNADRTHHRIPDVAVIRTEDGEPPYLTRPPLLAVEVVSPESVFRDHHVKAREYAEFGIPSYWIINPSAEKPGLLEMRLDDGGYRESAQVFGQDVFETDVPFPIAIVPHWLIAPGPWKARIAGG
ncbi:Uma2 family endonuclease [Actinomadura craniellae]|uniref:Uma2 family endonuclease n=1 Tax=Actinomadura craniellae TaxID=2231787 RepID=A0A365H896_9ACTN|nr:Uma2 family endonuclease [Actinomadura craniellae]RAY15248.1 Uma2 family endonuclease [Actinomadura craniellae]